jgi:hypothetical protein
MEKGKNMNTARQIHMSIVALLLVSVACASLPAISTPDTGVISTAAAQTVIAGLTQQNTVQATPSAASTITLTSEQPTLPATETSMPTHTRKPLQQHLPLLQPWPSR